MSVIQAFSTSDFFIFFALANLKIALHGRMFRTKTRGAAYS